MQIFLFFLCFHQIFPVIKNYKENKKMTSSIYQLVVKSYTKILKIFLIGFLVEKLFNEKNNNFFKDDILEKPIYVMYQHYAQKYTNKNKSATFEFKIYKFILVN